MRTGRLFPGPTSQRDDSGLSAGRRQVPPAEDTCPWLPLLGLRHTSRWPPPFPPLLAEAWSAKDPGLPEATCPQFFFLGPAGPSRELCKWKLPAVRASRCPWDSSTSLGSASLSVPTLGRPCAWDADPRYLILLPPQVMSPVVFGAVEVLGCPLFPNHHVTSWVSCPQL